MRISRLGWAVLGFTGTLLLAWGLTGIWPATPEPDTEVRVFGIERIVRGGDAFQPATAGQQPAPALAGDDGSTRTPQGGGGDDGRDPLPPSFPDQPGGEPAPAPSAPPTTTMTSGPASPSTPATAPEPAPAPGLLDPALTTACLIADRLAHLC